jgi:uncharacterized YigZ family protein
MAQAARPYRVAAGSAEAEVKERGSRFLAVVQGAADEGEARALLAGRLALHPGATHHCFAWRLGLPAAERCSDAGEPAGTAGQPMLRVLRGAELSDVAVVVSRWFGGTKLGKGGLARSYAGAVKAALADLPTAWRVPAAIVQVTVPFERLGAVKALVRPPEVELLEESYAASQPRLVLRVAVRTRAELLERLASLGCGAAEG